MVIKIKEIKKVILYYYSYTFFTNLLFFIPVIIQLYIHRGINTNFVFIFEAIYYLCIFLFEIPCGLFADKYNSFLIAMFGLLMQAIGYFWFALSFSITSICISQIILGISGSMISGADKACIFDKMKFYLHREEILVIQKRANVFSVYANLFSYILGGYLLRFNSNGIILLTSTSFCYIIGLYFFIKMRKFLPKSALNQFDFKTKLDWHSNIIKISLLSGLILGIFMNFNWIIQLFYNHLNLTSSSIGILYALCSLLTIILSKFKILSNKKITFSVFMLLPLCYFITIFTSRSIIVVLIIFYSLIKISYQPFAENLILSFSNNSGATNLSIYSWLSNAVQVLLLLIYYSLFKYFPYEITILILSFLTLIIICPSVFLLHKKSNCS